MRLRFLVALFVIAAGVMVLAPGNVSAKSTPKCKGKTATIVMTEPGEQHGTEGDDVIIGTSGDDWIYGEGGTDIVCGLDGDDHIYVSGWGSWAVGGSGADCIEASNGANASGGSGSDEIYGDEGTIMGESGDDYLYSEDDGTADGGSGDDYIEGDAAYKLLGGSGRDFLVDVDDTEFMDCGSNADSYYTDDDPEVRRCENFEHYCGCLQVPNLNMLAARLDYVA